MPLFEAQFLIVEENIWFAEIEPYAAIQHQENTVLKTALLIADDAEAAYLQACAMIDNLSEANFDGPGDITNLSCKGLSELRKIVTDDLGNDESQDSDQAQEIDYASSASNITDIADIRLKNKDELEVFRLEN